MVEFHVNEHNTKMPHPAFSGQTPNEIFLGTGAKVPDALGLAKGNARAGTLIPSRTNDSDHGNRAYQQVQRHIRPSRTYCLTP